LGIIEYANPVSDKFNSIQEFKHLAPGAQSLTVIATVVATIFTALLLGLGGLMVFRAMVDKFKFKHLDPQDISGVEKKVHEHGLGKLSDDRSKTELIPHLEFRQQAIDQAIQNDDMSIFSTSSVVLIK